MIIKKLKWDTEFFGINVGKITLLEDNNFDLIKFKQQIYDEKFELVYVFKLQKMLPWDIIVNAELELVDIMMTMSKKFKKEQYLDIPYKLNTKFSEKELNECYYIAEETSIVSRFYNEKKIGPMITRKLYRKWIDNALNKSFSDGVFILKESNSITGIHLIKTDKKNKIGYFTLTGVNPKYKRKGIGSNLWTQSFGYWANMSKINIIKSPFSIQNIDSLNFHIKMGFNKVEEIKYIYHFRNNTY